MILCSLLISCGSYQSNYSENSTNKTTKEIAHAQSNLQAFTSLKRVINAKNLVINRTITKYRKDKVVEVIEEEIKDKGREDTFNNSSDIRKDSIITQRRNTIDTTSKINQSIKKDNNILKSLKGVLKWASILIILLIAVYFYRKIVR